MKFSRMMVVVTGLAMIAGCQEKSSLTVGRLSTDPIVIDQAMEKRTWDRSTAFYENGNVTHHPVGFAYDPTPGQEEWNYYYADTGTFFVNLVTMPYTFYNECPTSETTSRGVASASSYTGNPYVPESPVDMHDMSTATSETTQPTTQPMELK